MHDAWGGIPQGWKKNYWKAIGQPILVAHTGLEIVHVSTGKMIKMPVVHRERYFYVSIWMVFLDEINI